MVLSLNTPPSLLTLLSTEKITLQGDIPKISTHQNIINNSVTSRLVKSLSHFFFFLVKEPKHWSLETAELSLIFLFGMTGMLFDTTLSLSLSLYSKEPIAHFTFSFLCQRSLLFGIAGTLFNTLFSFLNMFSDLSSILSLISSINTPLWSLSIPHSLWSLSLFNTLPLFHALLSRSHFDTLFRWFIADISA